MVTKSSSASDVCQSHGGEPTGFFGDVCETKMDRSKEQQVTWEGEICLTRGQRFVFLYSEEWELLWLNDVKRQIRKYHESVGRMSRRVFETCGRVWCVGHFFQSMQCCGIW